MTYKGKEREAMGEEMASRRGLANEKRVKVIWMIECEEMGIENGVQRRETTE